MRLGSKNRWGVVIATVALSFTIVPILHASSLAASPGPTFVYPNLNQTIDDDNDINLRVNPVQGASGYLYGFFQNAIVVWENYVNERTLSGTEYSIVAETTAHDAIEEGGLQIWARALVNGEWTDATIVDVTLTESPHGDDPGGDVPALLDAHQLERLRTVALCAPNIVAAIAAFATTGNWPLFLSTLGTDCAEMAVNMAVDIETVVRCSLEYGIEVCIGSKEYQP